MTHMPSTYEFELASKRPKYYLLLALQVNTGSGFETINRAEGDRPAERTLRMNLEIARFRWLQSNYFADAELRIVEIEDDA